MFETIAGPVAGPGQAGSFYRGLRTVALDGTYLHVPDDEQVTWRYPKRVGELLEFGYRCCVLLRWSSAAPGPCSPPVSAPKPRANFPTPAAC
ncbi:hypothetical protein [Streptomyces noursei]|uniref:hypothetical protein n=1 Tax=Streptomyces noursei TaxID=1971 RepID=UPI0023B77728|nr:hypothetical protein [Streptomyces noursei]